MLPALLALLERHHAIEGDLQGLATERGILLLLVGHDAAVERSDLAFEEHVLVPVDRQARAGPGGLAALQGGVARQVQDAAAFHFRRVLLLVDCHLRTGEEHVAKAEFRRPARVAEHDEHVALGVMDQVERFALDVHTLVVGAGALLVDVDRAFRNEFLQVILGAGPQDVGGHGAAPEFDGLLGCIGRRGWSLRGCGRRGPPGGLRRIGRVGRRKQRTGDDGGRAGQLRTARRGRGNGDRLGRGRLGGRRRGGRRGRQRVGQLLLARGRVLEAHDQVVGVVDDQVGRPRPDVLEGLQLVRPLPGRLRRGLFLGRHLGRRRAVRRFQPDLKAVGVQILAVLVVDERGVAR